MGVTHLRNILVSARHTDDVARVREEIRQLLRYRHEIAVGEPDDFRVRSLDDIVALRTRTARTMTTLLVMVAAVSLLVGGIGVMNIMLVAVQERTREIGIRLAVGARQRAVLRQFLAEAALISATGGVLGIALGFLVSQILSSVLDWPTLIVPQVALGTSLFAAVVGCSFGWYPAQRAHAPLLLKRSTTNEGPPPEQDLFLRSHAPERPSHSRCRGGAGDAVFVLIQASHSAAIPEADAFPDVPLSRRQLTHVHFFGRPIVAPWERRRVGPMAAWCDSREIASAGRKRTAAAHLITGTSSTTGGSVTITALFIMGSVAILVLGILTRGIAELLLPARLPAETPLVALARLHYLLFGATIFIVFATLYLWLTRRGQQVSNEIVGKVSFWLMFIGFNAAFLPRSMPGGGPPLLTDPLRLWHTASTGVQLAVVVFLTGAVTSAWHIVVARRSARRGA